MAQPFYLVTAERSKLQKIARYARSIVQGNDGDPVIAVGSLRIVLTPEAVGEIVDRAQPEDITGRRKSFDEIVSSMGAQSTAPVGHERLATLLAAREPAELSAIPRQTGPNSDLFIDGWDWHLKRTRLVDAWSLIGTHTHIDWGNLRVGQIDTGFRVIPCLGFSNPKNPKSDFVLTDLDRNYFPNDFNYDPVQHAGTPFASEYSAEDPLLGGAFDGHGTRTGSVLAGFDPTADTPYFGAAPRVPFIPVRICDSVIINHVQEPLSKAIEHLVQNGCSVITLSMGMALTLIQDRLRKAIDYAYEQGVIFVSAAGNIWDPVVAPARLNRTLSVGGCTPSLTPWNGSSFGPEVDLCAPAWPIRRASVDRKGQPTYGYGDGTSFATPMVAATAAMWLLHRGPEIEQAYPYRWQRVEAFKRVVTTTAAPGSHWNTRLYGSGILDAFAALTESLPAASSLHEDRSA